MRHTLAGRRLDCDTSGNDNPNPDTAPPDVPPRPPSAPCSWVKLCDGGGCSGDGCAWWKVEAGLLWQGWNSASLSDGADGDVQGNVNGASSQEDQGTGIRESLGPWKGARPGWPGGRLHTNRERGG